MADDINALLRRLDAADRRLDTVERNLTDQAKSLTEIVTAAAQVEGRVKRLEEIHHDRRVDDAKRVEREAAMKVSIEGIHADLKSIKGGINKVLWGIATAVILAFVGFVLRGGLNG